MNKSIERKMQKIAYGHRGLNRHMMQLKRSLDEISEILNGGGAKKKKAK